MGVSDRYHVTLLLRISIFQIRAIDVVEYAPVAPILDCGVLFIIPPWGVQMATVNLAIWQFDGRVPVEHDRCILP